MTAYELRISDWSSDVCSSDLKDCLRNVLHRYHRPIGRLTAITDGTIVEHQIANGRRVAVAAYEHVAGKDGAVGKMSGDALLVLRKVRQSVTDLNAFGIVCDRSEERRVGKELVSTCRSRWSAEP